MRKLKIFNILTLMIYITIILINVFLIRTNIIPGKYLLVFSIFSIAFLALVTYINVFKKSKKTKTIFNSFFIIVILILLAFLFYLNKTLNFLGSFEESTYKLQNYSVITLADSSKNDINEITSPIHLVEYDEDIIGEIETHLDQYKEFEMNHYESLILLVEDLYSGKIDSILIENSYFDLIEEYFETFKDDIKVVYEFSIEVESISILKTKDVTKETFNVYISGVDTYGSISNVSRSDVNIVATINPITRQILLTSIPRDYYVKLRKFNAYDKLTHAGIYGINTSIEAVEDLLDIEINYYAKVNFTGVVNAIDALGGVDVYSKHSFDSEHGLYFNEGYNRMDGETALLFSRIRKTLPGGDRARGENQQAVIAAIIEKATSAAIVTRYEPLLNSLEGSFQTNIVSKEINALVKMQLNDMKKWNVTSISLNGSDSSMEIHSFRGANVYVMVPYKESIEKAANLICKVQEGEVLDGSYGEVTDIKTPVVIEEPPIVEDETEEDQAEDENAGEEQVDDDTAGGEQAGDANDGDSVIGDNNEESPIEEENTIEDESSDEEVTKEAIDELVEEPVSEESTTE